jgi:CRISPR system Cascade subunit CasE
MSYFSMVHLQRTPEAHRLLRELSLHGDAYRDHCLIWKLFPGAESTRDFVFRRRREPGDLSYYVVSHRPPQPVPEFFTMQTKPYYPQLAAGEWVRFELQANPTVSRKSGTAQPGERRRSIRHDLLMDAKRGSGSETVEAAARAWLCERSAGWGLQVQSDSILTNGYTQHRLRSAGRAIQFSSLDYCGTARVATPELLIEALLRGVGHARGFGCGLLLVQRLG